MGSSEKQEALVKESWELMKENIPEFSFRFFTLYDIGDSTSGKRLFSFLKDTDEIPQNNPELKSHAVKACEAAIQLREKGEVVVADTTLKYLGSVHLQKGVIDRHFEVVKEALLKTLEEALGEKCNEEMKGAWGEAYDQLAAAIQAEMKQEATCST